MNLSNLFQSNSDIFDVSSIKYKKPIDGQIIAKLKDRFKQGFSKIMVGVTAEANSLTAAVLLKQALEENAIAMVIDLETSHTSNLVNVCSKLGLNTYILKREAAYQAEASSYRFHKSSDIQHFLKRFINYHLLIQADNLKAALVDIIDKSNRLLGTRPEGFYGHLMPFYSLYKSEMYDLARFLGIPDEFTIPAVCRELLYPGDIAVPWDKLDPVLFLLTEKQISPEQISRQYSVDFHWLKRLKSHIDKQSFKTAVSQFIL